MIKKSLKYLGIVLANLAVLFVLLNLWIDEFELEFNEGILVLETLKLFGISILALGLLRILISAFRNQNVKSLKWRMGISTLVVIMISSYFYFNYGSKIYQNRYLEKDLRNSIISKIKPYNGSWYGNKAEHLTAREYKEITKVIWFPELPKEAENISYDYEYEGFLPDYSFSISYDLPINHKVDTMEYKNETFSKSRTFAIVGNKKRVTYSEGLW